MLRASVAALCLVLAMASPAFAQHDHMNMNMAASGWTWSFETQAFLNGNIQDEKFTTVHQIESENWFMVGAMHRLGGVNMMLHGMFSLEPFTVRAIGSAEVFQTGETYRGAPLINYQHPHDLVMGLTAHFDGPIGHARWLGEASVVGEPALGPPVFMHRASAEANPTAPLSHHNLDSTHVTYDVITGGVTAGDWTWEASTFHGAEPDENRLNIQAGALDSYSGRVSWRSHGWHAQASAGHLKQPDPTEATDVDRFTASIDYTGALQQRPLAVLFAWGLNHEPTLGGGVANEPAWLAEATWHARPRDLFYTRAELVDKDILTAGIDSPGLIRPHILSNVGALTIGYERAIASSHAQHVGAGADVTVYRVPANLEAAYGQPIAAHVFLRYHFSR